MTVLSFVINRRTALYSLGQGRGIQGVRICRQRKQFFRKIEKEPPVAVGHRFQHVSGFISKRQGPPFESFCTREKSFQCHVIKATQDKHLGTGKDGRIELEGRVLSRRANEDDGAVFHMRQEAILLRSVETVDLIHEQQRAPTGRPPRLRRVKDFPQVSHA